MTYPAGVQTSKLTFSNPKTHGGKDADRTEITVQPTASIVWAETGEPLDDFAETVAPSPGMPGVFTAPCVDQPGVRDQAGNAFTMWAYIVTRRSWLGGEEGRPLRKTWQPLLGQAEMDFDTLPGGSIGLPVSVPIPPVTSVAGLTNAVGAAELAGALGPHLPNDVTPESVAAALPTRLGEAVLAGVYERVYAVSTLLGDGGTDATAAIQAQLNAANAAGGGTVRVYKGASGAYKTTSALVVYSNTVLDATGATISLQGSGGYVLRNSALGGTGARDKSIRVVGGTWTRDTFGSDLHMMAFHRIDGITVRDAAFISAHGKYAVLFSDATRFQALSLHMSVYSDGVHIQGPSSHGLVDTITGTTGDDFVAITARDYPMYELTPGGGDVSDVEIRNVDCTQTNGNLVHLIAGLGVKLRNVLVDGVKGKSIHGGGVALTEDINHTSTVGQDLDGIIIRNVSATVSASSYGVGLSGAGMKNVIIDGVTLTQQVDNANAVAIGASTTALGVTIRNLTVNATIGHAGISYAAGAAVKQLIVAGATLTLDPAAAAGMFITLNGSPGRLIIQDVVQAGGGNFVSDNSTAAQNVVMSNVAVTSAMANAWQIGGAAARNIQASNLHMQGMVNGFFVLTAGSLDLQINNFRAISGNLLFRSAAQTVRINGQTARCDLTALTPSDGDMIYNTNATPACGVGVVVYNTAAAKWKNIYSGLTN